jgi:hypothetical protein
MIIISKTPESNGGYKNQTWESINIPENYIAIPDSFLPTWEQFKPFINVTIENDIITSMTDNSIAREASFFIEAKTSKTEELRTICNQTILSGFYSNCLGVSKHFDCDYTDQSTIQGLVIAALLKQQGLTNEIIKWKSTGEPECYEFTVEQILTLGIDMKKHIETNIDKFNTLRISVNNATTTNEISAIIWD